MSSLFIIIIIFHLFLAPLLISWELSFRNSAGKSRAGASSAGSTFWMEVNYLITACPYDAQRKRANSIVCLQISPYYAVRVLPRWLKRNKIQFKRTCIWILYGKFSIFHPTHPNQIWHVTMKFVTVFLPQCILESLKLLCCLQNAPHIILFMTDSTVVLQMQCFNAFLCPGRFLPCRNRSNYP